MGGGTSNFEKNAHEEKADGIKKISDEIRDGNREVLVVLDENGKEIGRVDGNDHTVKSDELDELSKGKFIVHNHPEDGTFTPEDILKHVDFQSAELYAVGPTWTYRIRPKNRIHPENKLELYQAYSRANGQMRDTAEREFIMKAKDNPSMWANYEKWVLRRWDELSHEWLQKNASKYGYEYSRTSVKGKKK